MLTIFRQISLQWHRNIVRLFAILKFINNHVVNDHKRFFNRDFVVETFLIKQFRQHFQLHVRRELWIWSIIERIMKQLLSSHVETRNIHQRNEFILITRNRSKFIVIMSIDNDKIFFFILFSQLSKVQINIVIVFLIALKHDFQQRCKKLKIFCAVYDSIFSSHQLHALSTLLLMNIEFAIENNFVFFVIELHAIDRLNRMFLNEIHFLLIVRHYHRHIDVINQLRRVFCFFVCMTIILSFFVELELKNFMHFTQFETLRANND